MKRGDGSTSCIEEKSNGRKDIGITSKERISGEKNLTVGRAMSSTEYILKEREQLFLEMRSKAVLS